jgi:membrane-associated phospholipid phosphatase
MASMRRGVRAPSRARCGAAGNLHCRVRMRLVHDTDHPRWSHDALAAALLGATALVVFLTVSKAVATHVSAAIDGGVQAWTLAHQSTIGRIAFRWITILGGIMAMRIVSLIGAAFLWYRGRGRIAAALLVVPIVADVLYHVAKRVHARPRPLGLGEGVDSSYSFPSGHATVSAAVCGAFAYVLFRDGLIGREVAVVIAVLPPLIVGISRVYLNVHWATDVVGGWCAGLFVAALWVALYAHVRGRFA